MPPSSSSDTESQQQQQHQTSLFRSLNFQGSIPLKFSLSTPTSSTSSQTIQIDSTILQYYYLQVPRIGYLTLLLPKLIKEFIELTVIQGFREIDFEKLEFESRIDGQIMKTHWPIGLLYDYHTAANHPSIPTSSSPMTTDDEDRTTTTTMKEELPPRRSFLPPPTPSLLGGIEGGEKFDPFDTSIAQGQQQREVRRIPSNLTSTSTTSTQRQRDPTTSSMTTMETNNQTEMIEPFHIIINLHPHSQPNTTNSSTSRSHSSQTSTELIVRKQSESTKQSFMSRWKESEHVRWGSSGKSRIVGLKRGDQDGLWEGVRDNDFEKYWSIASKLIPLPSTSTTLNEISTSTFSPHSSSSTTTSTIDTNATSTGSGMIKNVPIRYVLMGDGGRGYMVPVNPISKQGTPTTLGEHLSTLFPLLFPPPSSSANSSPTTTLKDRGVYAIIQGIVVPLESEIQWLASCMIGGDGWVTVVVVVVGGGGGGGEDK